MFTNFIHYLDYSIVNKKDLCINKILLRIISMYFEMITIVKSKKYILKKVQLFYYIILIKLLIFLYNSKNKPILSQDNSVKFVI